MHNYLLSEFLDAKGQTPDDYHSYAACKNVISFHFISHPSYVQCEAKNHQKMISGGATINYILSHLHNEIMFLIAVIWQEKKGE